MDAFRFEETLEKSKIVTKDNLQKAIRLKNKAKISLPQILINNGYANEDELFMLMSQYYSMEYQNKLQVSDISTFIKIVPLKFIQKYKIVPFSHQQDIIYVGLCDPEQLHPMDELQMFFVGYTLKFILSKESELLRIIHQHYEQKHDPDAKSDLVNDLDTELDFLDHIDESQDSFDLANEAPIIKMVNVILTNAIGDNASDIHIEPQEKDVVVRYRVDGMLHKVLNSPKSIQNGIISRIKIMADMNIAENRLPQDGRIKIRFAGKDVDVRVSSLPTQFGERIVMRLLNTSDAVYSLDTIGMQDEVRKQFVDLINSPHGIILVTGPTGSGKTSTLYTALGLLKNETINIITVEDPVEYQMDGVSQVQAKNDIGLSFAQGLRSILRQDPDVIMVGEIRDEETARVAIQSSLTGHLVFSTLHTNDAPSAVHRLIDMNIEPYLVTSTCLGFIAQRLLRVLCQFCKAKEKITGTALKKMGLFISDTKALGKSYTLYKSKGCAHCFETGYSGRSGIYELLILDDELRECILSDNNIDILRRLAIKKGMTTLRSAGLTKVIEGVTSIEEVLRVT